MFFSLVAPSQSCSLFLHLPAFTRHMESHSHAGNDIHTVAIPASQSQRASWALTQSPNITMSWTRDTSPPRQTLRLTTKPETRHMPVPAQSSPVASVSSQSLGPPGSLSLPVATWSRLFTRLIQHSGHRVLVERKGHVSAVFSIPYK